LATDRPRSRTFDMTKSHFDSYVDAFGHVSWLMGVFLIAALYPWPSYNFYDLLRYVVFGGSLGGVVLALHSSAKWLSIPYALLAILFNPVLPVHLSREIWVVIDVLAAIVIYFLYRRMERVGVDGRFAELGDRGVSENIDEDKFDVIDDRNGDPDIEEFVQHLIKVALFDEYLRQAAAVNDLDGLEVTVAREISRLSEEWLQFETDRARRLEADDQARRQIAKRIAQSIHQAIRAEAQAGRPFVNEDGQYSLDLKNPIEPPDEARAAIVAAIRLVAKKTGHSDREKVIRVLRNSIFMNAAIEALKTHQVRDAYVAAAYLASAVVDAYSRRVSARERKAFYEFGVNAILASDAETRSEAEEVFDALVELHRISAEDAFG